MIALHQVLEDYLAVRRTLGFKLERPAYLLNDFIGFMEREGATSVTTELAVAWATKTKESMNWRADRLDAVRGFARYLQAIDPSTEVPPAGLLPRCSRRTMPYIYTDAEIAVLIAAAHTLRLRIGRCTYATLIGLLAVTGMRTGEAIRLNRDNVNLEQGLLTVRNTKFGKSREVVLHPATVAALTAYIRRRDELIPHPSSPSFFISRAGTRLIHNDVDRTYRQLVRQAGLQCVSPKCRPRLPVDVPGPCRSNQHLLVPFRDPGVAWRCSRAAATLVRRTPMSTLAPTLQAFFTERLARQRQASPHTVAAYRDTFRLLLAFAERKTGRVPSNLRLEDLDAPLIGAFLDHLEGDRHNSVRTRNARLAAVHSLFQFAALRHPENSALIQRVLAIPQKRGKRELVTFLDRDEIDALLAAPNRTRWVGRRDHALLLTAVQTGLRVSEITSLICQNVEFGTGAHVRCHGKGRKERVTPLTGQTVAVLRTWMAESRGQPTDPLFPGPRGMALTRDAVAFLVSKYAAVASEHCPSLRSKKISPHVLRHTCAMQLLHAGVDTSVIALWLGHESIETTQIYLHADLALKERALARTAPPNTVPGRYCAPDAILAFLESL